MELVFTSKGRKQEFEKAIRYLSSTNNSTRAFWDDELMRLGNANNKRDAEIVVREMLGALRMAGCLAWENWFTGDTFLILNAEDALVWSDFE